MTDDYNFAYLDEQTRRMIRRRSSRAGGARVPGALQPRDADALWLGYRRGAGQRGDADTRGYLQGDRPGSDDTTNAVSIRKFFEKTAGVAVTEETEKASVIQTRHRIPEAALTEDQILVYQVPIPEPLRFLEPRETETRKMHSLQEYGLMHVKLTRTSASTAPSPPLTPIRSRWRIAT